MARRIAEHPEAVSPARQLPRANRQRGHLGLIEVADPDVEVELLRMLRVMQLRRPQVGCPLEGHAWPVRRVSDHHPVALILDSLHAQQFLIEARQRGGLGAGDA